MTSPLRAASLGVLAGLAALALGGAGLRAQEPAGDAQAPAGSAAASGWAQDPRPPTAEELRELVGQAEAVALRPKGVRLESFRGDTINGVFLVDSDLPSARHVAFGKDPQGYRYVWFSRRNPLRASLVAMYQVDGRGAPDVLYWRQVDFEARVARAREFRAPAAAGVRFEYASGPPCGKPTCEEAWRTLPLERVPVEAGFFQPLAALFAAAAEHGEPHLDRPRASLEREGASSLADPAAEAVPGAACRRQPLIVASVSGAAAPARRA